MEANIFFKENKMMSLASIAADNGPRVVPISFMHDCGKFYFSSGEKTHKVRNIKVNDRVAFAIEDSTRLKAVVGRGTAKVLPVGGPHDELLERLVVHLVGSLDHPYGRLMMGPSRVIVEITPTSTTRWEIPPAE